MDIGGVSVPDGYSITYTGYGLYNERYKLLQTRLNRGNGSLIMIYNDLVAQETSQKMLAANMSNVAMYKEKVYVREIITDGDGTGNVIIPVIDNQTNDADSTYLVNNTTCYIISDAKGYIKTKILSKEPTKVVTESKFNDDGSITDTLSNCWKVRLYAKLTTDWLSSDNLRLVIEKV